MNENEHFHDNEEEEEKVEEVEESDMQSVEKNDDPVIEDEDTEEESAIEEEDAEEESEVEDEDTEEESDIEEEDAEEESEMEVEDTEEESDIEEDDAEETGEDQDAQEPEGTIDTMRDGEEDIGINLADIGDLISEANQMLDEVGSLRGSLGDIEVKGESGGTDLSSYGNRMRNWKNNGYNVIRLETVLETGVEELAKRVFSSFERDVKRLKEIEKSLDALDTTGFKKKESDIRENLKDPETIIPTLKHLIELEIDIRRKMEMNV